LPDAGNDGFAGKPRLVARDTLPLRCRQHATGLALKIDAGGFAESEPGHVGTEALDAQIHGQLEEVRVHRLCHRLVEVDVPVTATAPVAVFALMAGQAER